MIKLKRTFAVLLLCTGVGGCFWAFAADSWRNLNVFHGTTPAGYDVLLVEPGGAVISFLGLIECPELEGAQQVMRGVDARIVNADGKTIVHFPRHFSFRITVTLRKTVLAEPTDKVAISEPLA